MNENNYYVAKTIREMSYLIKEGFALRKVVDDAKNPKYKIFLFKDSQYLQESLKNYK